MTSKALANAEDVSKKIRIEFTADDEILGLIEENTRGKYRKLATNTYKCLAMIAGGTAMHTACKLTGIPKSVLGHWRSKEWYSQAIELIRKQHDEQLDGKMTETVHKGLHLLHERLDKGDAQVMRDGSIVHKPVSAKDLSFITATFFDKRNLLRNKPTSISSSQSTDERLDKLQERFREIAVVNGSHRIIETESVESDYGETFVPVETTQSENEESDTNDRSGRSDEATKWCFTSSPSREEGSQPLGKGDCGSQTED